MKLRHKTASRAWFHLELLQHFRWDQQPHPNESSKGDEAWGSLGSAILPQFLRFAVVLSSSPSYMVSSVGLFVVTGERLLTFTHHVPFRWFSWLQKESKINHLIQTTKISLCDYCSFFFPLFLLYQETSRLVQKFWAGRRWWLKTPPGWTLPHTAAKWQRLLILKP